MPRSIPSATSSHPREPPIERLWRETGLNLSEVKTLIWALTAKKGEQGVSYYKIRHLVKCGIGGVPQIQRHFEHLKKHGFYTGLERFLPTESSVVEMLPTADSGTNDPDGQIKSMFERGVLSRGNVGEHWKTAFIATVDEHGKAQPSGLPAPKSSRRSEPIMTTVYDRSNKLTTQERTRLSYQTCKDSLQAIIHHNREKAPSFVAGQLPSTPDEGLSNMTLGARGGERTRAADGTYSMRRRGGTRTSTKSTRNGNGGGAHVVGVSHINLIPMMPCCHDEQFLEDDSYVGKDGTVYSAEDAADWFYRRFEEYCHMHGLEPADVLEGYLEGDDYSYPEYEEGEDDDYDDYDEGYEERRLARIKELQDEEYTLVNEEDRAGEGGTGNYQHLQEVQRELEKLYKEEEEEEGEKSKGRGARSNYYPGNSSAIVKALQHGKKRRDDENERLVEYYEKRANGYQSHNQGKTIPNENDFEGTWDDDDKMDFTRNVEDFIRDRRGSRFDSRFGLSTELGVNPSGKKGKSLQTTRSTTRHLFRMPPSGEDSKELWFLGLDLATLTASFEVLAENGCAILKLQTGLMEQTKVLATIFACFFREVFVIPVTDVYTSAILVAGRGFDRALAEKTEIVERLKTCFYLDIRSLRRVYNHLRDDQVVSRAQIDDLDERVEMASETMYDEEYKQCVLMCRILVMGTEFGRITSKPGILDERMAAEATRLFDGIPDDVRHRNRLVVASVMLSGLGEQLQKLLPMRVRSKKGQPHSRTITSPERQSHSGTITSPNRQPRSSTVTPQNRQPHSSTVTSRK